MEKIKLNDKAIKEYSKIMHGAMVTIYNYFRGTIEFDTHVKTEDSFEGRKLSDNHYSFDDLGYYICEGEGDGKLKITYGGDKLYKSIADIHKPIVNDYEAYIDVTYMDDTGERKTKTYDLADYIDDKNPEWDMASTIITDIEYKD